MGNGQSHEGTDHRNHRPGRLLPGGTPAGEGLRGPRAIAAARRPSTRAGSTISSPIWHDADARLFLHHGDLTDGSRLVDAARADRTRTRSTTSPPSPTCGSPSTSPSSPATSTGLGATRLLEALRISEVPARFYQAGTSEMFGGINPPQNEETPVPPALALRRQPSSTRTG